ncbi:cysteine desulfurase NifS [candidate division KSB1 bacterium]|nr:cysteine desulfurase NifS [candidate division KSB1 bacterium]
MKRVYFDHSATTPIDPDVLDAMLPYFKENFGNPSSIHAFGRNAKVALEDARERVAAFIGAEATELFFTSGGTEADNMAIKGVAVQFCEKGNHIITSKPEHHAVIHTCEYLEAHGFNVTYLKPDQYGMVSAESVAEAITDKTILISIMHANNEVGTINPIGEIAQLARENNIRFHTDAVQSFGKLPINVKELPVDLISFSAHKIYGPKGTGGLFIRKGVKLTNLLHGGAHERNRRAGTENVAGIVGLAKAVDICRQRMVQDEQHIRQLRDTFHERLQQSIPKIYLNGHPEKRLAGHLNLSFEFVEGESILLSMDMKGIAASSGSACTSGSVEPSHVLMAMGIRPELGQSAIRFTLGRYNTMEEVDYAVEILPEIIKRLRAMSPLA